MDESVLEALGLSEEDKNLFLEEQQVMLNQILIKNNFNDENNNNNIKKNNSSLNFNDDNTANNDSELIAATAASLESYEKFEHKSDDIIIKNFDDHFAYIISKWPEYTLIEMPDKTIGRGISLAELPLDNLINLINNTDSYNFHMTIEFFLQNNIVILLLSTLSSLCHHEPVQELPFFEEKVITELSYDDSRLKNDINEKNLAKCWNKGVGFGVGSSSQEWNPKISQERINLEQMYSIKIIDIISKFLLKFNIMLPNEINEIIVCSCLPKVLVSYLKDESIMNISNNFKFYKSLLEFIQVIVFIEWYDKIIFDYNIPKLISDMRNIFSKYNSLKKMNADNKFDDETELFKMLENTNDILDNKYNNKINKINVEKNHQNETANLETIYINKMKSLQFGSADLENYIKDKKSLQINYLSSNPKRSKRLALEITTLSTSLPLSLSSSVFLRCDSNRLDLLKALIIGPEGTPYENGCFEFDILFPTDFPTSPPIVDFKTTGHGTVRFNPNLYNCGKVCLSILNTWQGRPEELWNESTSSLLQVLVSIQSLILVPEPFYNEPGFQSSVNYKKKSDEYNQNIREQTLRWAILDSLKNPSPYFKEVINEHFKLKSKIIKKQCENWYNESVDKHKNNINDLKHEILDLIKLFFV